jgi:hypothetical protein
VRMMHFEATPGWIDIWPCQGSHTATGLQSRRRDRAMHLKC